MKNLIVAAAVAAALLMPSSPTWSMGLTASVGYRTGGFDFTALGDHSLILCVRFPCALSSAETRSGEVFGLVLDVPLRSRFDLEILLNRQDASVRTTPDVGFPPGERPRSERAGFDLTTFQLGVSRHWRDEGARPFAAIGVGVSQVESSLRPVDPLVIVTEPLDRLSQIRLSASLAAGAKVPLSRHLGLRVEGRAYWVDLPSFAHDSALLQLEATTGLTFDW